MERVRSPAEWVAGYPRDIDRWRSYGPAADRFLAESRMWSRRFGIWLHDHLAGRPPPPRVSFNISFTLYLRWVEKEFPALSSSPAVVTRVLGDMDDWDEYARLGSELNFHRMNKGVANYWQALLYGDTVPDRRTVLTSRSLLALSNIELLHTRRTMITDQLEFFAPEHGHLRAWLVGAATELDALIACHEYVLRHPGSLILPAPPQFEARAGRRNVDIIAIGPRAQTVAGIQVKSSAGRESVAAYDPAWVTVLDGNIHLGNVRAMRTRPRSSDRRVVSWPGLISAHHLLATDYRSHMRPWIPEADLVAAQYEAKRQVQRIRSRNAAAYATAADLIEAATGL